jgi:hypothetical protein
MDALTYNASSLSIRHLRLIMKGLIDAINIVPQLDQANPALRSRLIGEAKFLRAFMYFTLVKTYGGVPIIDHLPNPSSDEDRVMQLTRRMLKYIPLSKVI